MKKEIEEFKNRNGGVISFTTKEMLGAIDVKLGRIEARLIEGDKNFSSMNTTIKWHSKLITGLYSIWGAILLGLMGFIKFLKGGG